jgi:hypothetical protein
MFSIKVPVFIYLCHNNMWKYFFELEQSFVKINNFIIESDIRAF